MTETIPRRYGTPAAPVSAVRLTDRGAELQCGNEVLQVEYVRDDVIRLRMTRAGRFDDRPSWALAVDPMSLQPQIDVDTSPTITTLRTPAMVVTVTHDPLCIDVRRTDGSPVATTATDTSGRPASYATLNDAFWIRRRCAPSDAFYGLGEKTGPGNRRGRSYTLWNTDVLDPGASGEFTATHAADDPRADNTSTSFDPYYVSIPLLHHLDAATGAVSASFIDNAHRAEYDLSGEGDYLISFDGGFYTEYLFAGPTLPQILEAYTWLTGRATVPPIWSLGYQQCRWFPYSSDDVRALGRRLREAELPCDALWLDIDYMDGYRVFTWDPERFPDAPQMLADLAAEGFAVVSIIDPGVKREVGYAVYDDAVRQDVLCRTASGDLYTGQVWPGATAFPDFVTPEARAWWGALNAEHVRSGLAGIWNDMNEPATGDIPSDAMRFGRGAYAHEEYHNQYALLMAMGTAQGLDAALPDRRRFILSRAGSAGIQRYAANWLGDNQSRWDHLALSMPMSSGFGLSGQPVVGSDVGGFAGDCSAELFVRWMQYGALTPFFRNHNVLGATAQYPWSFGDEVQDLARDAITLRYRLMPYLYAAFIQATETGLPIQRPLVLAHADDPEVRDIDDEFLAGDHLLVAPVTAEGETSRPVYLPAGSWYDVWTGTLHQGSRWVTAHAPLSVLPLYARAGAVVPRWPEAPPSAAGYAPATIDLDVFVPPTDGTWTSLLQEDDGATTSHAVGDRIRTELTLERVGDRLRLTGSAEGSGYPGMARERFRVRLQGATLNGLTKVGDVEDWDPTQVLLTNSGTSFELEVELADGGSAASHRW